MEHVQNTDGDSIDKFGVETFRKHIADATGFCCNPPFAQECFILSSSQSDHHDMSGHAFHVLPAKVELSWSCWICGSIATRNACFTKHLMVWSQDLCDPALPSLGLSPGFRWFFGQRCVMIPGRLATGKVETSLVMFSNPRGHVQGPSYSWLLAAYLSTKKRKSLCLGLDLTKN